MPSLMPTLRAIAQLDDPRFLGTLLLSVALAALAFAALVAATVGITFAATPHLHLLWAGLEGIAGALLALWLFMPVAVVIAACFADRIAAAVERRWYPGLPLPRGAPLAVQLWDGVVLGLRVLLLNVIGLILALLLPGVGLILGWLVASWAIGRGLFMAVAMRRMSRAAAIAGYRRLRLTVLVQGGVLALAASVPLLNLLVPVVGTAAMVHVLHRSG